MRDMVSAEAKRAAHIKNMLCEKYGNRNISVRRGCGASKYWIYVTAFLPLCKKPRLKRILLHTENLIIRDIERHILSMPNVFIPTFLTDVGPGDRFAHCLLVFIVWRK